MNKKEFIAYVTDHIKEYLTEEFAEAKVEITEVKKNNGVLYTNLVIARKDENVTPCIRLDRLYEEYEEGKSIEDVLEYIANVRTGIDAPKIPEFTELFDYQSIKNNLQIRIHNKATNNFDGLATTEHGDFIASYHVILNNVNGRVASFAVRNEYINSWGIDMEQLHMDAVRATEEREVILADLLEFIVCLATGETPRNILHWGAVKKSDPLIMVLTNEKLCHGAALVFSKKIMDAVYDIFGGVFYIIPSSVHEVIVAQYDSNVNIKDLSDFAREINQKEVPEEDVLSDTIMIYDKVNGLRRA